MLHEFHLYIHSYTELVQKVLPGELFNFHKTDQIKLDDWKMGDYYSKNDRAFKIQPNHPEKALL